MPTEGAKIAADCLPCNGGHVCGPAEGVVTPVGCPSGHYCPGSTTTAIVGAGAAPVTAKQCTVGHSCPLNVHALYKCQLGTSAGAVGAVACTTCPAGKFCLVPDATGGAHTTAVKAPNAVNGGSMASATVECTIGYYCLAGAAYPKACNEGRQTP